MKTSYDIYLENILREDPHLRDGSFIDLVQMHVSESSEFRIIYNVCCRIGSCYKAVHNNSIKKD